jgi:ribosomal protein S18 acetylase RimI-like enzyme
MTASARPMTEAEFAEWSAAHQSGYIDDIVESSGMSPSDARVRAEQQWREYLPDGQHTRSTWFLKVLDGERPVGSLWLGQHPNRPDVAYVYDIEIDDADQGRGFGRAAMLVAEELVREAGYTGIALNVFGFNERARRLYDSLGYGVVSTAMIKRFD